MTANKPLVVVIEDDLTSAEALAMVLRDWGGEPAHFLCAEDAATELGPRVAEIDFIITDYHIGPGIDAVAGARALQTQATRARILVLSGSFHGRAAMASEIAGLPLIHKPADAASILAWLEAKA